MTADASRSPLNPATPASAGVVLSAAGSADASKEKAEEVNGWTSEQFTGALRHDQKHPLFNSSFRQLLHVSFKLAAKKGQRYLDLLKANEAIVAKNVTENLYERHLRPLFVG